ncbi:hypothetical protein ACU4GD_05715 [Cupriavidus basilensis]
MSSQATESLGLGPNAEVLYAAADGVATVTMNRPQYHNAQNSKMTVRAGRGVPARGRGRRGQGRDPARRRQALLGRARYRHAGARHWRVVRARLALARRVGKPGGEMLYTREQEVSPRHVPPLARPAQADPSRWCTVPRHRRRPDARPGV